MAPVRYIYYVHFLGISRLVRCKSSLIMRRDPQQEGKKVISGQPINVAALSSALRTYCHMLPPQTLDLASFTDTEPVLD